MEKKKSEGFARDASSVMQSKEKIFAMDQRNRRISVKMQVKRKKRDTVVVADKLSNRNENATIQNDINDDVNEEPNLTLTGGDVKKTKTSKRDVIFEDDLGASNDDVNQENGGAKMEANSNAIAQNKSRIRKEYFKKDVADYANKKNSSFNQKDSDDSSSSKDDEKDDKDEKDGKDGKAKKKGSNNMAIEAGIVALTQLLNDVKKRVDNMDQFVVPEVRNQMKEQNELISVFKKSLDSIYGAVKNAPKPIVPGKLVLEECTEYEKAEAARRDERRGGQQEVLECLWRDIVEQDAYLARTHLSLVREEFEKKLSHDGRRAEAEILIQEMLDRFRSDLEQEYARKIEEAKIILKEEAHVAAWERLFEEVERRKRELQELMELKLEEEKQRLLEFFHADFTSYRDRTVELQDRLVELLAERNNMAKDFMMLQADYRRFIDLEKGEDAWVHMMEMRDYKVRGAEEFTDKWTPLVIPETLLAPMPWWEEDRGLVERDPDLPPRDSRDVTGNPQTTAKPAIPEKLTPVPEKPRVKLN